MKTPRIYLDNNASTPLDSAVLNIFLQDLESSIGNPSSVHSFGQEIRNKVTKARRLIADCLQVRPSEIVFTSGGTEGVNMVLRGILDNNQPSHIISSNVEHSCVFSTLQWLENNGHSVTYLPAGLWGAVSPEEVEKAITPSTKLIALMAVNNETGVKTDIHAIAHIAKKNQIPFFVDGVSLLGKELFSIPPGVSAMSFSGHKFHGPKGVGFNFIHPSLKLNPLIIGGGQESMRRGGTENVSGIVAMAAAVSLLKDYLPTCSERMLMLRNRLEKGIMNQLKGIKINGEGPRIVNTTNLSFEGIDGESLILSFDLEGLAVSHGSACSSGALEPSRILLNMGIPRSQADSSIRFSLSRLTTEQEIDNAIEIVIRVVSRLRSFTQKT